MFKSDPNLLTLGDSGGCEMLEILLDILLLRLEPNTVWPAISTNARRAHFHHATSSREPRPSLHLSHWNRGCGSCCHVIDRLLSAFCNFCFFFKHLQEHLAETGEEMTCHPFGHFGISHMHV